MKAVSSASLSFRKEHTELTFETASEGEDKLLTAKNKWLIGHEEAAIEGAFNGLKGANVGID